MRASVIRVMIESPYAGDVKANEAYLAECIAHSLGRREAPFASHGFYVHYLDDKDAEQRQIGIACRHAWASHADVVRFYTDRGLSTGMWEAYLHALNAEKAIDVVSIVGNGAHYQDHCERRSIQHTADLTKRLLAAT